ncbi:MAG: FKBP-type peptidyl-prolyl cis-trans isomerase [Gammaproteobacteria bacterium]|nr:FKBP-type peptidyl-prolyl cis-trans isomerase [Gammaproteobacteria bacterium]
MSQVKTKIFLAGFTLLAMQCIPAMAVGAEEIKLNDNTKRLSYSLGYQIGGDFKRQGVEMDPAAIVKGIEDGLGGTDSMISRKAMSEILMELKRKVVSKGGNQPGKVGSQQNRREAELEYLAEGKKFLKENASRSGVKTTGSGLQYKIIEPGTSKVPGPTDLVSVHYRGTLINGNEFDSTNPGEKPITFKLDQVIPGWTEGLQLIGEGGKIQLFVPYVLAYRNRGPLGHRTLLFDVELVSVTSEEQSAVN